MPISFDALTKIISITTPTAEATAQELVDACRDWEDELPNMTYEKVVDAVGKADLGGGVTTGIVMTLSDAWQIQFWGGSGVSKVTGGTIVGGVGGEPIKATGTAGDLTIQIQPTDATITTANTDAIETGINDIKGTGFSKDTDSLVNIRPETDKIQGVRNKTDNLPSDPADQSNMDAAITVNLAPVKMLLNEILALVKAARGGRTHSSGRN